MNPYIRCYLLPDFDADKLPVPLNWSHHSILDLMKKLTPRMQGLCGVVAAEMVVPIWESYSKDSAPRKVIEAVKGYFAGTSSLVEVREAAVIARARAAGVSRSTTTTQGHAAVKAVETAVSVAALVATTTLSATVGAVVRALRAAADADSRLGVYVNPSGIWWNKCKPLLQEEYGHWVRKLRGEE